MPKAHFKNPNFYLMLFADAVVVGVALVLAYMLRFDFFRAEEYSSRYAGQVFPSVGWFIPLKLIVFYFWGLYRGMWRFTSLWDLRKVAGATATSSLILVGVIAYQYHFEGFSRSVYLLDAVFTFVLASGLRIAVREFFTLWKQGRMVNPFSWVGNPDAVRRKRTIVIGAGACGEALLRELNRQSPYDVVCCVDDDPQKRHRTISGIRVYGGVNRLESAINKFQAELILIAIAKVDAEQMRRIVGACEATKVPFKRIPTAGLIASGDVSIKELRDVNYEDLLGRQSVQLDESSISTYLSEKTIFVTGAGGSIGSELVRQVIRFRPARLILVEAGEENLFNIQMELKNVCGFDAVVPALVRVQDELAMRKLFEKYSPNVVFHAAAYKHVPLMEQNPWQAIENNVIGSYTIMNCAKEFGVERFVLVSTDKAVRPTNVMGASKRMTELIMHSIAQDSETVFMAVRFGNVLGSSGSVIPAFRRQIERGGPVTVTHPEMTRYFMLIPEAARLILQAGTLGEGGEIFILEMGTPVKIADMARDLIRLSGKEPDSEIKIEITGVRPGEKLYEELITDGEGIVPTQHEKIMVLRPEGRSDREWFRQEIETLRSLVISHDAVAIRDHLKEIIPEYAVPEYAAQKSDAIL